MNPTSTRVVTLQRRPGPGGDPTPADFAVEERPIRALEQKKTTFGKQKSLFGDLKGLLDKLTTAAKALKKTTDFLQMKAASDDETIVKVVRTNAIRMLHLDLEA